MWIQVYIRMYASMFTCTCIHEYTFKYIYVTLVWKMAYFTCLCLPILFRVLLAMEPGEKGS